MQNKIGRVMSAAVIAGCDLGSISVPAFAEGSFKSHLSSVRVGFETRSWHDNANDNTKTIVWHNGKCSAKSIIWGLHKDRWVLPDIARGNKALLCKYSATRTGWGIQPAGDYHLTVEGIDGGSVVSLPSMTISY
ncbi:MAG: hypothetical protein E7E80_00085 [Cutibacterium avidum]|nr:hypothetical protein [Cutibacterium avidum]MDU4636752.1 hypothetical protein [Cutibacterium avidum]MDU7719047.1 hypothetical protein [Cutibacterium avidum]